MSPAQVTAIHPLRAIEGGRITLEGTAFPVDEPMLPEVRIGDDARARRLRVGRADSASIVPSGLDGGRAPVRIDGVPGETAFVDIAAPFATGLHQVDNPVFDRDGNLYVTYSGTRGQQVPVSIFRVRPNGTRETFSSGIVNPTSMAIDPRRAPLRVEPVRRAPSIASPTTDRPSRSPPISASPAGSRSPTTGRCLSATARARSSASIRRPRDDVRDAAGERRGVSPGDGPDGALYVTGPTLSSYDALYRIDRSGTVTTIYSGFGRPQGLAFDRTAALFVVEALAGASGLYRDPRRRGAGARARRGLASSASRSTTGAHGGGLERNGIQAGNRVIG